MAKKRRSRVRKVNTKNWGARGTSVPLAATVSVPSGKCPFIMEDSSRDSVLQWIALLTDAKHEKITYMKSVYRYWARHSFDINSNKKDYHATLDVIEEVVPEYTKKMSDLMFHVGDFLEGA